MYICICMYVYIHIYIRSYARVCVRADALANTRAPPPSPVSLLQFLGYHLNEAGFAEYERVPEFHLFNDESSNKV